MKLLATAIVMSSLLVAGSSLGIYFITLEPNAFSAAWFPLTILLYSDLLPFLSLLPAAMLPSTLRWSALAAVAAATLGTFGAVALVVMRTRGSLLRFGSDGWAELSVQLRELLGPVAAALIMGLLWRQWRSRRPQAHGVDV